MEYTFNEGIMENFLLGSVAALICMALLRIVSFIHLFIQGTFLSHTFSANP